MSLGSTPDFSPRAASTDELFERAEALGAIDELLAAIESSAGGLLVLDGAAGMGKSRLLEVASERAEARRIAVHAIRGEYLERSYAWRGAGELLGEQALEESTGGEEAALGLLRAYTRRLATLTERAPVLLVIDDSHWLDAPTLRLVHFLAGRLDGLQAGILMARRPREASGSNELLLHAIAAHPSAQLLMLSSLSRAAVGQLVRQTLGEEAGDEVCELCAELTGGNPYYLRELLRSLPRESATPTVSLLDGVATPTLTRSVLIRLSRIGPKAAKLAQALAILGDEARTHHLADLTGLALEEVLEQADALAAADLVRIERGLSFAHPLVRAVVEADIPAGAQQAAHAQAASLLRREGALSELVAAHLLRAPSGALSDTAEILGEAAARAFARGAPASAVTYLERALEEPTEPSQRATTRVLLAEAAVAAGAPQASEHLERALLDAPREDRARIRLAYGWALHAAGRFAEAATEFAAGLGEVEAGDEGLRMELRTGANTAGMLSAEHAPETHRTLEGISELPEPRDAAELHYQSQLLVLGLFSGLTPASTLAALAERQLAALAPDAEKIHDWTRWNVIGTLSWCDRFELVLSSLDPLLDGEATLRVAMASYARSWPSLWTGRIAQAAEDARRALDLWTAGAETYLPAAAFWLVSALCEMGHTQRAAAALTEIDVKRWEGTAFYGFILAAQGRLAVAEGDFRAGLEAWLACGAYVTEAMHLKNPTLLPWRSEAVLAAARLQEVETARALAHDDVTFAEGFGARRALGAALRAQAAALGAAEGIACLERSISVLSGSGAALEHAHALVDLGAALRRDGSRARAREPLRAGLRAAQSFGASTLVDRAAAELLASGARDVAPVGESPLTPSEQRVAQLAAQGLTNREIAAQLFVTVKAVEFHLSRVFAKLDIRGRKDLPRALGPIAPQ